VAVLAGPFIATTLLLAAGGALKVVRPADTARALRQVGIPASPTMVRIGAAAELAVATAAVVDGSRPFAALVAGSYLAFAAFVLVALRRHLPLSSCGCFGAQETPPTAVHVAVNLAAAAIAAAVALGLGGDGAGLAAVTTATDTSIVLRATFALSTLTATWLAYVALTDLPKTLRSTPR
jgi:hypothetical protein